MSPDFVILNNVIPGLPRDPIESLIHQFVNCALMLEILLYIAAPIVLTILLALILPSKGKIGEKRVASKLDRLPKTEYCVLNDVMLQTPKGTSQIDHLVVSIYGIFVIETK